MSRKNEEEFPNGINADSAAEWFRQINNALLRTADEAQVAALLGKTAFMSLRRILLPSELQTIEDWPPGYICQLWQALQQSDSLDRQTRSKIFQRYQKAVIEAQNKTSRSAGATYSLPATSSFMRRLMDGLLKHCRKD